MIGRSLNEFFLYIIKTGKKLLIGTYRQTILDKKFFRQQHVVRK
jgi:hypothetical protein